MPDVSMVFYSKSNTPRTKNLTTKITAMINLYPSRLLIMDFVFLKSRSYGLIDSFLA